MSEIIRPDVRVVNFVGTRRVVVDAPIASVYPDVVQRVEDEVRRQRDIESISCDLIPKTIGEATIDLETQTVHSVNLW